ncbi:MAG: hypothetical protein LBF68_02795 [Christensenellaceae bacterium]|nr:hypothetical protein [Christensenellaceae bacterium]
MQFINGNADDEQFRERIIDCFINKVILWNDKIIITFNIKGTDNEKVCVDEIINGYNDQTAQIERFDLDNLGGR